jgi:nucleotide-binding universal stress UspA family protein
MKNVMAAVDGTDGSVKAATFAQELARRFEARLTLLHVIELYPSASLAAFGVTSSDYYAREMAKARAFLQDLVALIGADDAEQVIEMGAPSEVICHEASERHADHLVLGSHSHGKLARIIMGSVATRVAWLSEVSVTVVK